jgi:hypothetical protein
VSPDLNRTEKRLPDLCLGTAMSWSGQLPVACREDAGRADSSTSCRLMAGSLWVCRPAWHPFAA